MPTIPRWKIHFRLYWHLDPAAVEQAWRVQLQWFSIFVEASKAEEEKRKKAVYEKIANAAGLSKWLLKYTWDNLKETFVAWLSANCPCGCVRDFSFHQIHFNPTQHTTTAAFSWGQTTTPNCNTWWRASCMKAGSLWWGQTTHWLTKRSMLLFYFILLFKSQILGFCLKSE